MKIKSFVPASCLFVFLFVVTAEASSNNGSVNIPDGSFEGLNGTVTTSGNIGAWHAQLAGLLPLGASIQAGTATALNGPTPQDGLYELEINLTGAAYTASVSQTL